jgi:riboflavin transporter FmnP
MQNRPSGLRVFVGILLAPLIPCVVFSALLSGVFNQWSGFWFGTVAMIVVSEVLSLVIALPLYLGLQRVRNIGALECAVVGIAVTAILNLGSLLFSGGPGYSAGDGGGDTIVNGHVTAHGFVSALLGTAVQSVLGVAIALAFWFIAIRTRKS